MAEEMAREAGACLSFRLLGVPVMLCWIFQIVLSRLY